MDPTDSPMPSPVGVAVRVPDVLVVAAEAFRRHVTPPGHPERVERANVMWGAARRWAARGGRVAPPIAATDDMLHRVHAPEHVDAVAATAGRTARLDVDTFTSSESYATAKLAAGAAVAVTDHALDGGCGLALVRPPGHHAERARVMGFCLFNNIAVAAAHALSRGAERVAIIDYDVHHGNGTQQIFYDDPRVLYVSLHQYPFYPGTGASDEVGDAAGAGTTVNVPLDAGAGDADYDLVCRQVVAPVVETWNPELVLASAGYDAHAYDPLGGMRLTTGGYARITGEIRKLADRCCEGRMAIVVEGGYDLVALKECVDATLDVMATPSIASDGAPEGAAERGAAAVDTVRVAQAAHWPTL